MYFCKQCKFFAWNVNKDEKVLLLQVNYLIVSLIVSKVIATIVKIKIQPALTSCICTNHQDRLLHASRTNLSQHSPLDPVVPTTTQALTKTLYGKRSPSSWKGYPWELPKTYCCLKGVRNTIPIAFIKTVPYCERLGR